MKKWYSIAVLVLVLALAGTVFAACGDDEETTTTAAPTTTTAAAAEEELGIFFEDLGNNVVMVTDVPAPGLTFPIHTTPADDMASTVEAFDADGGSLGMLETDTGEIDYSEFAGDVVKIVVTDPNGTEWEYMVP